MERRRSTAASYRQRLREQLMILDKLENEIAEKEKKSSTQSSSNDEEFVLWRVDKEGNPTTAIASFLSLDRAKHYAKEVIRKKVVITVCDSSDNLDDYEYYPEDEVWSSF